MMPDSDPKTDEKRLEDSGSTSIKVKVDSTGLPLLPQPSTSPFDPLNYPNVTPSFSVSIISTELTLTSTLLYR